MKRLCLVCKDLHALALPGLYRDIEIVLGDPEPCLITSILFGDKDHPGVKCIKNLSFKTTEDEWDEDILALAVQNTACRILTMIPKNQLKTLR